MFYGFRCSGPRDFLLFLCTKLFASKKILQTLPSWMYTLKEKKLDYTSLLNNISGAACSRQLESPNKCHFPSCSGFSASLCIYISLVPEHAQTSIYTWHSHRSWLNFIFTFQMSNHLQLTAKPVLVLLCLPLRTITVNSECWDNVTSY